jgi:hypothetical protein
MVHKQVENYHLGEEYDQEIVAPYAAVVPVNDNNTQVEVSFKFTPVYNDEPLRAEVTGIIDRMDDTGLYDLKTSSVSWSQKRADEDLQATMYCYYAYQTYGKLLPFTFVVYRKDWKPTSRFDQIQFVTTTRTPSDFDRLWLLMNKAINDIQAETEWPCHCRNLEHAVWSNT